MATFIRSPSREGYPFTENTENALASRISNVRIDRLYLCHVRGVFIYQGRCDTSIKDKRATKFYFDPFGAAPKMGAEAVSST